MVPVRPKEELRYCFFSSALARVAFVGKPEKLPKLSSYTMPPRISTLTCMDLPIAEPDNAFCAAISFPPYGMKKELL